jgi:F0F1-type ATP synthase assembly protein I
LNAIVRGLKATYNFFAGDAILLIAVLVAFLLAFALERADLPNPLIAAIFVACIVGGLVTTLAREVRGRPRQR